jgi:type II secretory pathway pseudopilin PulG
MKKNQTGQTMIETLIAIFILVSGIAAAVGLAVYAFSSSESITKQIIGVGLAREGIEAVKNMRDTNWLQGTLSNPTTNPPGCYNYASSTAFNASCYKGWMGTNGPPPPFCLDPTANNGNCNGVGATTQSFYLGKDPTDTSFPNFWNLQRQFNTNNYGLDFSTTTTAGGFQGFYYPSNSTLSGSGFYRKIIITEDDGVAQYGSGAGNPFNKDTGPRLLVTSQVWWKDKKCPVSTDWPGLGKCSVELRTYLTNWKNYSLP